MSATNSTTHYELPVFLGTDKPAWLVDWNGAMGSIDSAIYEAKTTADSAVAAAGTVASDLATLSGTVSTQGSSITTLSETLTTAVGNINTINGNINTINSLIGNGTPTTTDQTIIGAINEIHAQVITQAAAAGITYDNTTSGLTADDVQEAIDENVASIAALGTPTLLLTKNATFTATSLGDISGYRYIFLRTQYSSKTMGTQMIPRFFVVDGNSFEVAYHYNNNDRLAEITFTVSGSDTSAASTNWVGIDNVQIYGIK